MPDAAHQLTISLLGTPEAQITEKPLILHHQKARALLYYLAATGRSHTRDHLAALLWSETPESNARHSLRSSLYHIRQALQAQGAGDALIGDGDLVHLRLADEACDVIHFRRLLAQGSEDALCEAIALRRGSFLQGVTLHDAPLYEEWLRFEEYDLAQAYLTALQRLLSWAEERQDWNRAISYAQRIVQVDPLAEEMQQHVMRLYLRGGAVGQALRQYQRFETELRHELGLAPSRETQALFTAALTLRHGSPAQARKPTSDSGSLRRTPLALPFVGREEVSQKLLAISQSVGSGQGCAVLIQGEDGIGRSRLLNELAVTLMASQPPWMILQGSCSPFDDLLSYGPFLEAFQNAGPGDLSDLLLQTRETDTSEQGRFLWNLLQALQMLTRNAPLLLTIDDLQWANSPTLHLFGFLATRLRNLPVLLIGAVQRAEAIPALQRLVTLGRRHGDIHLLSLSPFTLEDISALATRLGISSVSDTWTSAAFSEWLYEKSGGSPFILAEIIAQLQAEGILTSDGNGLRLDAARWRRWRATFTLPETTHDLVAWRLTNLSSNARALLDVLAVANLPIPYTLLHDFPGIQNDQLLPTIEELVARGLIVETGNELLDLPHNLLRETLLHALSHLRRRDIHRQLACIIEQCPALQERFPLRQVALHAVAGQDSERARRYGLRILDELVRDNANAQTAIFLRHLYDLLAPSGESRELPRLTSALGHVYSASGQLEEALSWHRKHLEQAAGLADLPAVAAAHFELGEIALVANDYQEAAAQARTGLAVELPARAQHTALTARGNRLLGAALAMEGSDLPSAERHLQEAASAHRLTDNTSDLCATLFELGNVAAQRGELRHALKFYQEAARTAEGARVHYFLALAHNNFAYHSLLLGDLEDARRALTTGRNLAERYELYGALMHLSSTRGELHLYLGEWQAAAEAFHSSLAQAEELRNIERQAGNRAGLALAERGQGHVEGALTLLEEALTLIAEQGFWHVRTRIQLWLTETLLASKNTDEAQSHLATALTTARSHHRTLLLLQGERLSACLLAERGDWHAANMLFSQVLARSSDLRLPLETARTQAAWGQALIHSAPLPHNGPLLLSQARKIFAAHDALADLRAIVDTVRA